MEIFLTYYAEHDHHVLDEIFYYTIQFSDQNIIIDQRDLLYGYTSKSDLDTMYTWNVINSLSFTNQEYKAYNQANQTQSIYLTKPNLIKKM